MQHINETQLNWGSETRDIREKFEQNLFDVRTRIDDVANLKTVADVRNKRAQYENGEYQKRAEDNVRLGDQDKTKIKNMERELGQMRESAEMYKRSVSDQIHDIEKNKLTRDETWANLVDLLDKLDDELYRRIAVEYNNQTLREHIEFIKQINEKEKNEMAQLGEALPFNDQVEFYKDQLKRVITNIRKDYEQLHMEQQRELEEWMRVKSEEIALKAAENDELHELELGIQLENIQSLRDTFDQQAKELADLKLHGQEMQTRLHATENHIEQERLNVSETIGAQNLEKDKLGGDLDSLLNDYNILNANKATLEYEIQVYKRLLDSQLDRMTPTHVTVIQTPPPVAPKPPPKCNSVELKAPENLTCVTSNAFGGKVQNKKEKKGPIGLADSSPDGKYIVIENIGSQTATHIDLSGWQIRRKVDSNVEVTYKIPAGTVLAPTKELFIWASSYKQQRAEHDLVTDFENWGIGINSLSRLISATGEEKSSFHQQITFSSRY